MQRTTSHSNVGKLVLLCAIGWVSACGADADATTQAASSTESGTPEPDDVTADPAGEADASPGMGEEMTEPQPSREAVEPDVVEPEPTEPMLAEPDATDPEPAEPEPDATDPEFAEPEPTIVEPVTEEDYYVRNQTTSELTLLATTLFNEPVELLENTVPAGQEVHIYHAIEGSGGHAMPSNFFGDFQVLSGDSIVYQGVVNADWQEQELGLVLVIEAPPAASEEALDYSCGETSDCEVKDVGNCCGYYPRCVNVNSPTPEPQCEDGVGGVCGWPEITHCECVENRCRSMQGDTEV